MNFSANRLRRASAPRRIRARVIHAVCRDFHLHTLRRLHTHFIDPGIIATGTITGEGKNI